MVAQKSLTELWQAWLNSTFQLLDSQYWDDWAPTVTTPTKPPVCSRHLAIWFFWEEFLNGILMQFIKLVSPILQRLHIRKYPCF